MKLGYIIGPFRAPTAWEIEENVRNAERLGLEVAKLGAFPIIPHANTRFFHGSMPDEFWIEGTAGLLLRSDFAVTVGAIGLPWKHSRGSVGEVVLAKEKTIPVFHHLHRLRIWLTTGNLLKARYA